jgi:hypothetical protein
VSTDRVEDEDVFLIPAHHDLSDWVVIPVRVRLARAVGGPPILGTVSLSKRILLGAGVAVGLFLGDEASFLDLPRAACSSSSPRTASCGWWKD